MLATVRLRPFDVSTAEGRAKERYRRAALTTLAGVAARAIAIGTVLASIPLAVDYLGPERYGLWMTISAVIALLAFADLGLGNGLVNAIAEAHGRDDREAAQTYVASALLVLTAMTLALGAAFAAAYPWVAWERVFNVSSPQAVAEAGPATAVFVGVFLVGIPLAVVQRVQAGYQEGFVNALWMVVGSVLGLAGLLIAIAVEASLPWLVLAFAGGPAAAALANALVLFGRRKPWLRPRWTSAGKDAATRLLRLGLMFFVLQLAVAVAFSSDNVIAAHLVGPEAVTEYSVTARLFMVAPTLLALALAPLWPAYGESIVRGDLDWTDRTLRRSVALVVAASFFASVVLVLLGGAILEVWVGEAVDPSFPLLLGFGVWAVMLAGGQALSTYLNAANAVRIQVVLASVMAAAAIALKVVFAAEFGLSGIVWATVVAYSVVVVGPYAAYVPRVRARIRAGAAA